MLFDNDWSLSTKYSPYVCTQHNFIEAYLFSWQKIRGRECWKAISDKFIEKHFSKNMIRSCQSNHEKQQVNQIKP